MSHSSGFEDKRSAGSQRLSEASEKLEISLGRSEEKGGHAQGRESGIPQLNSVGGHSGVKS